MADVTMSGPIFDGRAAAAVRDFCNDFERDYARQVEDMIRVRLHQVLKHPTGRYERSISSSPQGGGFVVDDGGIVYGPWLEGVGSRNRTTRFKGYATFRKVGQAADAKAEPAAEMMIKPYLRRMQ